MRQTMCGAMRDPEKRGARQKKMGRSAVCSFPFVKRRPSNAKFWITYFRTDRLHLVFPSVRGLAALALSRVDDAVLQFRVHRAASSVHLTWCTSKIEISACPGRRQSEELPTYAWMVCRRKNLELRNLYSTGVQTTHLTRPKCSRFGMTSQTPERPFDGAQDLRRAEVQGAHCGPK